MVRPVMRENSPMVNMPTTILLKNAILGIFQRSPSAEHDSQTQRFHRWVWHRIHAMTQPVDLFNGCYQAFGTCRGKGGFGRGWRNARQPRVRIEAPVRGESNGYLSRRSKKYPR